MSTKFSRRPRIQPLPPVCRKPPVTTSCYQQPIEPPEPLRMTLQGRGQSFVEGEWGSWSADMSCFRESDYCWRFEGYDRDGYDVEVVVSWYSLLQWASVDLYANNPHFPDGEACWPQVPLERDFPWRLHLSWDSESEEQQHVEIWLSN